MVYPAFPVLHQTFVLWEALELEKLGVPLAFYSIKSPGSKEGQQPEARTLIPRVAYLPSPLAGQVLRANARVLRDAPDSYGRAVRRLLREWQRDRNLEILRQRRAAPAEAFSIGWRARWEELVNTSGTVYLGRSLALLPLAAYLGPRLLQRGITHVHAHWATFSTTLALFLKWLFGIRFSFTAHAYDLYLMPIFLPVKLREAEWVVTCAQVNADFLRGLPGGEQARVFVNYHGVDLQRFRPRHRPPRTAERPRLVTCGSLRIYKGHHVLIRALAKMRRPADCVIIGDGPQRAFLEQLASELGVRERIEFTGALPQEKAVERYAEADVFVLASTIFRRSGRQDVIPNVLVEAMAMGLPVATTALPGIRELIDDGVHGRLVPPDDPQTLATVLDELLDDLPQRRRLGEEGRRRVEERFDRAKNILQLAELFLARAGSVADFVPARD
jgi:glycosyltransferase involved in cell wall biosynthesis